GTNAHLIIEEAPPQQQAPAKDGDAPEPGLSPVLVSAKGDQALRAQASQLHSHLKAHPETSIADVGYSLAVGRARLPERAAIVCTERDQLLAGLAALARGEPAPGLLRASAGGEGKVAFMFTGQGAQRAGMGRELYETFPVFTAALDEVLEQLDPQLERPLKEVLFAEAGSPEAKLLDRTQFTQPALFALEVALYRLVESFGLHPDYLVGHSIGELSAAHVAGVLSLEDACKLVAARGALMGALPDGGAMAAVRAEEQEVLESLEGFEDELALAAVNGPNSVVVSGSGDALAKWAAGLEQQGHKVTELKVSHAFHSPLMEPMLAEFGSLAKSLAFAEPKIAIASNLSGELATNEELCSPDYWVRHVREPVRFAKGIDCLERAGVTTYLELGPEGILCAMAAECLEDDNDDSQPALVASLRSDRPEPRALVTSLTELHLNGGPEPNWRALFGESARTVELPTYAFQRRRFWLNAKAGQGDVTQAGQSSADHPLLGAAVALADGESWLFTGRLSLQTHPWLKDHMIKEVVIFPGTALVELALRAGVEVDCEVLEELTLQAPLVLEEQGAVAIQLSVGAPDESGRRELGIYSRPQQDEGEGEWTHNAQGVLAQDPSPAAANELARESWPPQGAEPLELDDLYDRLAEVGFQYGPAFQGLQCAWRRGDELYGEVTLDQEQSGQAEAFCTHPALLDAAFHAQLWAALDADGEDQLRLPFTFAGVRLGQSRAAKWRVRLAPTTDEAISLQATDEAGTTTLTLDSLVSRPLDAAQLKSARRTSHDSLFELAWQPAPIPQPNAAPPRLAVLGELATQTLEATRHQDLAALGDAIEAGESAPDYLLVDCRSQADEPIAAAHATAHQALALVKDFLASEQLSDSRLVFVTERALATTADEDPELSQAPLVGLLRSAQSEHPERFVLADLDDTEDSWTALPGALASDEPQLALREGALLCPRLA
ncbi:MAG: acyltransferase domain-containing protein, partial [Gaiellales bacterium]